MGALSKPRKCHISFLALSYPERIVLVQEPGEDARVEVLEKEMHMQAGIMWGFTDRNELCSFPRQFSQHLTMSILYFGRCSVPVPCLLWLLAVSPLFPAITHVPSSCWFLCCSICWSGAFVLPISQGCLCWVLEGLQGADKWECCLPAPTHTMQKRSSASAGHVSVCSGSFVLVTFSQLNENPPQRLMQPEAIWDVQAHLLSSLSHLPTILQCWPEGNEGSRTLILILFHKEGSLLTSYPVSHFPIAGFRCLLSPPIPFFPRLFGGRWKSSSLLPVPLTFPTLYSGLQPWLLPLLAALFIFPALHQKVWSSSGGDSASGSPWPQSLLSFDSVSLCWKCD